MSRRVRLLASACVAAGLVGGAALRAAADDTPPTPSPSPSVTLPLPVLPTPSPSAAGAVTRLVATPTGAGSLRVSWQAGAGDESYSVAVRAGGMRTQDDTSDEVADFHGLPGGGVATITVVAHGAAADSAPTSTTAEIPAAVPGVTAARMHLVAAGLIVSWTEPRPRPPGARYLVEVTGTDGTDRTGLVAGDRMTVTGLSSGHLYSATITTVTDAGRSAAVDVSGVIWTPPSAAAPVAGAPSAVTSPTVRASATPAAAVAAPQAPAQRTLVSSPIAAAGLAGLAVVLGTTAIVLLLRRPMPGGSSGRR